MTLISSRTALKVKHGVEGEVESLVKSGHPRRKAVFQPSKEIEGKAYYMPISCAVIDGIDPSYSENRQNSSHCILIFHDAMLIKKQVVCLNQKILTLGFFRPCYFCTICFLTGCSPRLWV